MFLSISFFLFALLSHPVIIGFPVILIIYLYSFKLINKKSICDIFPFFLTIILFEGSLFLLKAQGGRLSDTNINIYENLVKSIIVFGKYIKLLLWPHNLSAIYTLDKENLTFLSLFIMIIFILFLFYTFKKDKELFFPISWFLIFYIPISNLFIPVGLIMADRYIYFASLGLCVLFSVIIRRLLEYKWKNTVTIILILTIIILSLLTIERCKVWKDSISLWTDVLNKYPNVIACNNRGRIYYDLKDYNKAIDDFTQALNLYPYSIDAYINRGLCYYQKEDYNKALQDYNMALKIKPDGDVYHNRGDLYDQLGDYEKAIKDYGEAIKINPDDGEAYKKRGNIYIKLKKFKDAIQDLTKALEYIKDTTIFYNRAIAWEMSGKDDKALNDYNCAIDLNPSYIEAYNNRGLIYVKSGLYERAIEDYNHAIELKPDILVYKNRGIAYGITGKYDKAIEDFTSIIIIDKNNVEAYNYRAITYCNMGNYDKAWEDVNKLESLKYKVDKKFIEDLCKISGRKKL
jgi:tetratricopeptide (TPR) repeat protein